MKAKLNNEVLKFYISQDGQKWRKIFSIEWKNSEGKARIGYYLILGHNSFEDWFYSNFIQLHCAANLDGVYDVKLTYYTGIRIKKRYNMSNPWIQQYYYNMDFINSVSSVIDFVVYNISHGFYISLYINEKYVKNTYAYNRIDFDHENLVYGFDMEKRNIYLYGYDKYQILKAYTLSFEEFNTCYQNNHFQHEIIAIKADVPEFNFYIDKKEIVQFLEEYLYGINSATRDYLAESDKGDMYRVYGLDIYDILFDNASSLRDSRITYILYEHKTLMMMRIEYFEKIGWLKNSEYQKIRQELKILKDTTYDLLLICMKYNLRRNEKILEGIKQKVKSIKDLDKRFTMKLVELLKQQ